MQETHENNKLSEASIELNKEYEFDLRVTKVMYSSEDSSWGIYSFTYNREEDMQRFFSSLHTHPHFQTIVIKGDMPKMEEGDSYVIRFVDDFDEKYGHGYKAIEVRSNGTISLSEQKAYVKLVMPEKMGDELILTFGERENMLEDIITGVVDITDVKGITENNKGKYIGVLKDYKSVAEVYNALHALNVSLDTSNKIIEHFGSGVQTLQVINENVYRLTEVKGLGFKTVDKYALNSGHEVNSPVRIKYGAYYVLEQIAQQGDTKVKVDDFDNKMRDILNVDEITDEFFNMIISDEKIYYDKGFIALQDYYDEELFVARDLVRFQHKARELKINREEIEEIIETDEIKNGFKFEREQKKAIYSSLENGITVITGSAGTGKSTVVSTIVNVLAKAGATTMGVALSGKATNVLLENGVRNAKTIHRGFGLHVGTLEQITKRQEEQPPHERIVPRNLGNEDEDDLTPFHYVPYDVIIIDEASMINTSLFAIMQYFMQYGTRIIVIGDNAQLPPIGHGNVFDTMLGSSLTTVRLTKIHRQAAKSGIITEANKIRNHETIVSASDYGTHVFGENKDFHLFNMQDKSVIPSSAKQIVQRFFNNPDEDFDNLQLIAPVKKGECGTIKLNEMVQSIANPLTASKKYAVKLPDGNYIHSGDRVINSGNLELQTRIPVHFDFLSDVEKEEYSMLAVERVYNGTIGKVVAVNELPKNKKEVLVEYVLEDGEKAILAYPDDKIKHLDLGYAITAHRSQGSGFHTVLFVFDYSAYVLLSKELIYTGMTRATKRLLMLVEADALRFGTNRSQSRTRSIFLKDMLEEQIKIYSE